MSKCDLPRKHLAAVTDCRNLSALPAVVTEFPDHPEESALGVARNAGRRWAAFAAGTVLATGAVAAVHHLHRTGDALGDWLAWGALLLVWLSALGGGIKLATWGAKPVISAAINAAKARLSEPAQALVAAAAMIAGGLGMWISFRGGYAAWWQSVSGEQGWSLALGAGQMVVAVLAGAALFTGGKYLADLAGQVLTDAGLIRTESAAARRDPAGVDKDAQWHPALLAALIAGGAGLIIMAAWLTPKLVPTIVGANVLAAAAVIAAVLLWAIGSNLGWWKGLEGLWKWATDASQKATATAGVIAVLMFSAGGLGLGWFTPATVPQAHAQCPPDCGGGSNGSNSYGLDASQFQPPQMPSQMPDYQGSNSGQPGLDQNNGISIYNQQPGANSSSPSNGAAQQGLQPGQNADGSWQRAANGEQMPNYQNPTPYTQGPGAPNPDYQGGQANPGSQSGQPNQGVQQPAQQPQQAPQQQPSQQDAGQQPNRSSDQQKIDDLTRQLQEKQQQSGQDRQRADDLAKQLQQNKQNQKQQQSPKFPSKDKKKDDKDEQDDRDKQSGDSDLVGMLLGAASTRRRKQDEQEQGPDTKALGQDASQAAQGLPGDVQTYVQSGQQIGQSSGQAAQGFGSAAQAGTSLASSAQSGAVNPQDAITVVQGVSQGIQGTADAINAGSQIVKTAQKEADQAAQAVGDANPQLKPQTEQFTQINDQVSQATDMAGQGAQLTSQGAGTVGTVAGMGSGAVGGGPGPAQLRPVDHTDTVPAGPATGGGAQPADKSLPKDAKPPAEPFNPVPGVEDMDDLANKIASLLGGEEAAREQIQREHELLEQMEREKKYPFTSPSTPAEDERARILKEAQHGKWPVGTRWIKGARGFAALAAVLDITQAFKEWLVDDKPPLQAFGKAAGSVLIGALVAFLASAAIGASLEFLGVVGAPALIITLIGVTLAGYFGSQWGAAFGESPTGFLKNMGQGVANLWEKVTSVPSKVEGYVQSIGGALEDVWSELTSDSPPTPRVQEGSPPQGTADVDTKPGLVTEVSPKQPTPTPNAVGPSVFGERPRTTVDIDALAAEARKPAH